jgi:hypothetical protein
MVFNALTSRSYLAVVSMVVCAKVMTTQHTCINIVSLNVMLNSSSIVYIRRETR